MHTVLWLLLSFAMASSQALALEFHRYHNQREINAYLRHLAVKHAPLVRFHQLGLSEQGREINYIVISKAEHTTAPAIYMNATHHGDEKSSTESLLALIDYLVTRSENPYVSPILERYAIYLQPLVNPDGHALGTRYDAHGHDPNRDYAYPERSDADSFKSQASRLVRQLTDNVKFRAAAAWHSGMEGILWPLGYSPRPVAAHDTFYTLAKLSANAMGIDNYQQSYADYPTRGEFIDYMYVQYDTLAMTFEVSQEGTPPAEKLAGIVKRAIAGGMTFLLALNQLDQGLLAVKHAPDRIPRPSLDSLITTIDGGSKGVSSLSSLPSVKTPSR